MSATRTFTSADQLGFARLSGDWNPMHTDAIAARRTLFGQPVVHGVHTLLWALGVLNPGRPLAWLEAKFLRGITLGDAVECQVKEASPDAFALVIMANGTPAARIKGSLAESAPAFVLGPDPQHSEMAVELPFAQAESACGAVPLGMPEGALEAQLPQLRDALPSWQIAVLLATTRIVGMECPGLHSLYNGLSLQFREPQGPAELRYSVATADARFSSVEIAVAGPGVKGTLRALFRPPPQPQPTLAEAASMVKPGEFSGWRALVVGGSRGLGEAAAKLIAGGGGAVCLTYVQGEREAQGICAELEAGGHEAHRVRWDVTEAGGPILPWAPTHLLYFATPHISIERSRTFEEAKFEKLCRYYVSGFHRAFSMLQQPLTVLYPSTIFLEEAPPFTREYCAAKAAGEALCHHLTKNVPGCRIHAPRLPRLLTDQTAGITGQTLPSALPVLLEELRILLPRTAA